MASFDLATRDARTVTKDSAYRLQRTCERSVAGCWSGFFSIAVWRRAALERRGADRRPSDGKIKAARCGAVGRLKSAGRSDSWHEARFCTTACAFGQPVGKPRLRAPRQQKHSSRSIKDLKAIRDQARADAERAQDAIERTGPSITPQALKTFARQARKRMRTESGGYRRDHLRALAQRVEVDAKEVRIMGSKSELLRTLVAASSAKTAGFSVPSFVPKWRGNDPNSAKVADSNTEIRACKRVNSNVTSGLGGANSPRRTIQSKSFIVSPHRPHPAPSAAKS
jgi:hypothetical protein